MDPEAHLKGVEKRLKEFTIPIDIGEGRR